MEGSPNRVDSSIAVNFNAMRKLKLTFGDIEAKEILTREELKTICGIPKTSLQGKCSATVACADGTFKSCSCASGNCSTNQFTVNCNCQTEITMITTTCDAGN
jgi:hypothetical protein